jgi:hypothetical protein
LEKRLPLAVPQSTGQTPKTDSALIEHLTFNGNSETNASTALGNPLGQVVPISLTTQTGNLVKPILNRSMGKQFSSDRGFQTGDRQLL